MRSTCWAYCVKASTRTGQRASQPAATSKSCGMKGIRAPPHLVDVSIDEAAPNATQSNAAADVEVAVQTNVADVAASDLRAVQRAIASGRWRENSQAKEWAGHAVAAAMKLDVETHKAKIVALLKTWIGNGTLVVVEGEDDRREKRKFVQVGTPGR